MKKKLFFCGGHVTPALAVLDALAGDSSLDIVFIGRKYAAEGDRHVSAEYTLITGKGIRFLPISAGRLQRKFTRYTIPSLLKIPFGLCQALWWCIRERPAGIVSFGGYVAFPVAIAGALLRIPVITHEQTLAPGLVNTLIARFARRICVAFEETAAYFPQKKTVYTGLPMRKELFATAPTSPYKHVDGASPIVYITGGSLGAQYLNTILFSMIPTLTKKYTVIHQVGGASIAEARSVRSDLPDTLAVRYLPEAFIPTPHLSWILRHAWLVIGRSGANTTLELAALGKVALLVPLPWAAGNEQLLHATWLVRHGGAIVVEQKDVNANALAHEIERIHELHARLQAKAKTFSTAIPRDGAKRVAGEVLSMIS